MDSHAGAEMPKVSAHSSILVAEDDPSVRAFIVRALEHEGYQVIAAEDGMEACNVLEQREFDVLVADIMMPGMDGVSLARKVSQKFPAVQIILISGYAQGYEQALFLKDVVSTIMTKPFTLEEIQNTVASALQASAQILEKPPVTASL